jgi:hypothetical protein
MPKFEVDKILIWTKHTLFRADAFCRKVAIALEKAVPCRIEWQS